MDLELTKKVVLVSGSSKGIGSSIAESFLEEKARVMINGRNEKNLDATYSALSEVYGDSISCFAGDLTREVEIDSCIEKITETWGKIDILVSNIGSGKGKPSADLAEEEWQRLFDVNLFGCVRLVRKVVPKMRENGGGTIILVSSIAGMEVTGSPIAYAAAKAGVIALCKRLSHMLAPDNIRVNAVAPGNVRFEGGRWEEIIRDNPDIVKDYIEKEVPLKRFCSPEEVANCVIFLASEKASFITGSCLAIDGGQTKAFS